MATAKTQSEHDAILKTLQLYIESCKQGNSELVRPLSTRNLRSLVTLAINSPLNAGSCSTGSRKMDQRPILSPELSAWT